MSDVRRAPFVTVAGIRSGQKVSVWLDDLTHCHACPERPAEDWEAEVDAEMLRGSRPGEEEERGRVYVMKEYRSATDREKAIARLRWRGGPY